MAKKGAPAFSATDVIAILGRRGSGKTTLSRSLQSVYPRVVVIDRLREYSGEKGAHFFETIEKFQDFLIQNETAPRFKAVFQFDIESDAHDAVFSEVLRSCYYTGNLCLVIEEVHHFSKPGWSPKWLTEIYLTGRHNRIAMIATTQRPAKVDKTLLAQCAHIFSGCIFEKNDVNYLSDVMGEDAYKLPNIAPYHFLWFRPGNPSKIVKNR